MGLAANRAESFVEIAADAVDLPGDLTPAAGSSGIVLFAHGSGSSRHSPRNRMVARDFQEAGLGTLLFDLLTPEEEQVDERSRRHRFDIPLLASRLISATDWLLRQPAGRERAIGYFGASTGAAAALVAAAERPNVVSAVVSRGGRPDLAGAALSRVRAATLLIVGGADYPVLPLNKAALDQIAAPDKRLEVVAGATHLFEEPGALEVVAHLATAWFLERLSPSPSAGVK